MNLIDRLRRHKAIHVTRRGLMIFAAVLAVAIVSTLTIDLGPGLRARAEDFASKSLKRPVHIGALSLHVATGRVLVEDFSIAGLRPGDRPFFTAKRLAVAMDWSMLRRKDINIGSVEMADWEMLVEKWEDRQNFPKFTNDSDEPDKPKWYTVTMRSLRAYRGQFSYVDHEKPWSIVARNLEIQIANLPTYHGEATFHGGTVAI